MNIFCDDEEAVVMAHFYLEGAHCVCYNNGSDWDAIVVGMDTRDNHPSFHEKSYHLPLEILQQLEKAFVAENNFVPRDYCVYRFNGLKDQTAAFLKCCEIVNFVMEWDVYAINEIQE